MYRVGCTTEDSAETCNDRLPISKKTFCTLLSRYQSGTKRKRREQSLTLFSVCIVRTGKCTTYLNSPGLVLCCMTLSCKNCNESLRADCVWGKKTKALNYEIPPIK